jgi:[acyl-carrier-protein] S-malonyltransferase
VAGHSVGEYTALCASEVISLESAAKLLECRGKFMQKACNQTHGAMAACFNIQRTQLDEILQNLSQHGVCNIANDNSEEQIVISGEKALIEQATAEIKKLGGKAILLNVNGAFHSSLMQNAALDMSLAIEDSQFAEPKVPIILNVSATPTNNQTEIKKLLKQQIVSSVRWREIMSFALEKELEIVEIGTGQVLSNLAKRSNYPFKVTHVSDEKSLDDFLYSINN